MTTSQRKKGWDVWREGYRITGESSRATYMGSAEADTFEEACAIVFAGNSSYNPTKNTWWGCRLFDNSIDARRSFG